MFTKLTHNDLEVIQGGAVCLMPNVNNKEGDPFKGTLVPLPRHPRDEAYPMVYLPVCAIM
jgi:hypothetical protein